MENIFLQHFKSALVGELQKNKVAWRLYNLIQSGKIREFNEEIYANLVISTPDIKEIKLLNNENDIPSDLRFRHLLIKNIKKIPFSPDGKCYGISFSKGNKPIHSIFLGANGVGKTSLYSCLEYLGIGMLNTAKIRGYDGRIQTTPPYSHDTQSTNRFFLHFNGNETSDTKDSLMEPFAKVYTTSNDLTLNVSPVINNERIVCDSFYCSEYDVRILEGSETLTDYALHQLGLNEYADNLKLLYGFNYFVEKKIENASLYKSLNPLYKEKYIRFVTGIALGRYAQKRLTKINEIDKIDTLTNKNIKATKRIDLLNKILNKIIQEEKLINHNDWFSKGAEEEYKDIIQIIEKIQSVLCESTFEGQMKKVCNKLESFKSFRTNLSAEINTISNAYQEHSQIDSTKFSQQDVELKYFNRYLEVNQSINKAESNLQLRLYDFFSDDSSYSELKKEYTQLIKFIENDLKSVLQEWNEKIVSTLEALLGGYFIIDNDKISVKFEYHPFFESSKGEKTYFNLSEQHKFVEFNIKILSCMGDLNLQENGKKEISPRAYLNTFKYKLFCVALKLAFCCIAKKIYQVNYPLIIDDVFDSSDFDNRIDINHFAAELIKQHDYLLPNDEFPLQIIFFTQDDLIAEQFAKGIAEVVGYSKYKFSRIHDYHLMVNEDDKVDVKNKQEGSIMEDKDEYIRLEDIIP